MIVTGMEALPTGTVDYIREMEDAARESLQKLAARNVFENINKHLILLQGSPADEIIRTAEEVQADLIVIATHGRTGLGHLVFGSVAERVVRLSPCPVLVIRVHPDGAGESKGEEEQGASDEPVLEGSEMRELKKAYDRTLSRLDEVVEGKGSKAKADVKASFGNEAEEQKNKVKDPKKEDKG